MPNWERVLASQVAVGHAAHLFRSRVPSGWLVMAMSGMAATGVAFVPHPDHEWPLGSEASDWEEVLLPRGLPGVGAVLRHVRMYRCSVPGGWVVFAASAYPSLSFYPDPEHRWVEDAATELEAASPPEGTGTEPEASAPPEGSGTELIAE